MATAIAPMAQLLALADLSARCNNNEIAREAHCCARLMPARVKHLARYKLGRILLNEGHTGRGRRRNSCSARRPMTAFPHNHMGAARALFSQGARAEAADFAARFISRRRAPAWAGGFGRSWARSRIIIFDTGQRERGLPIYRFLYTIGAQQPRHVVRLAEALMGAGDYDEAIRMLRAQTAPCMAPIDGPIAPWPYATATRATMRVPSPSPCAPLQAEPANAWFCQHLCARAGQCVRSCRHSARPWRSMAICSRLWMSPNSAFGSI